MSQGHDILVLGTGTFAEEIADVVSQVPNLRVVGYVANMDRANMPKEVGGKPVHWIDELPSLVARHRVVCGLGTTRRHRFTDQAQQLGAQFVTPTHPSAHLSPTSQLGEGSIASVNVIVAAHTKIGRHVVLNRGAMVGHHTVVGDFVTVGPGTNIAGNCRIGRCVYVGMGAIVIDHVTVGADSVIGAGAVVTEDVPERVLVVGVPARIVKRDIEPK